MNRDSFFVAIAVLCVGLAVFSAVDARPSGVPDLRQAARRAAAEHGMVMGRPRRTAGRASCSHSPEELRALRIQAIVANVERVNYDLSHYQSVCDRYYTDDAALLLRGVGSYVGKNITTEYGYELFIEIDGVRNVALNQSADLSVVEWSTSLEGAAAGDVNDTATFHFNTAFYSVFIPPDSWQYIIGGLRGTETLLFAPCTDLIEVDYVVQDPDIIPFETQTAVVDPATICTSVMQRCVGPNQAYASYDECLAFMVGLNAVQQPNTECPYPLSSNTTACRFYHANNAYIDPVVHCPHTQPDSVPCHDQCRPACDSCPANGHCVVYYPSVKADASVYSCDCDDGYVVSRRDPSTGSALACSLATCSADWECTGSGGGGGITVHCNVNASDPDGQQGVCGCQPTFTWNSTTGGCDCVGGQVRWDIGTGSSGLQAPVCVRNGRCLQHQHCVSQDWNTVRCQQTSPPDILSVFLSCVCNPGYIGGFENPCACPEGNRVEWSSQFGGDVCLGPTQCTADWQCGYGHRCSLPADPATDPIGVCQ